MCVCACGYGLILSSDSYPPVVQARAPHSPVLIVGTHIDKVSRSQRQRLARCVELIGSRYGTTENRREGFPQIFGNFLVSCKSGRGISDLRDSIFDVASHVKENTGIVRHVM